MSEQGYDFKVEDSPSDQYGPLGLLKKRTSCFLGVRTSCYIIKLYFIGLFFGGDGFVLFF